MRLFGSWDEGCNLEKYKKIVARGQMEVNCKKGLSTLRIPPPQGITTRFESGMALCLVFTNRM